jgi:hypothetical protein
MGRRRGDEIHLEPIMLRRIGETQAGGSRQHEAAGPPWPVAVHDPPDRGQQVFRPLHLIQDGRGARAASASGSVSA